MVLVFRLLVLPFLLYYLSFDKEKQRTTVTQHTPMLKACSQGIRKHLSKSYNIFFYNIPTTPPTAKYSCFFTSIQLMALYVSFITIPLLILGLRTNLNYGEVRRGDLRQH